jgi:hypothetical protein
MAKYVYDVRKYFAMLKMYVKEYSCDVVKIYYITFIHVCCNLNLGLVTEARACEGAGQEGSLGITFHAPESAR